MRGFIGFFFEVIFLFIEHKTAIMIMEFDHYRLLSFIGGVRL